jgi:hypothetical protein
MRQGEKTNNTAKALSSLFTQFDTMAKGFCQSVNTISYVSTMTQNNGNDKRQTVIKITPVTCMNNENFCLVT